MDVTWTDPLGDLTMLWLLIAAGGTGILLGMWFRVPALLAASVGLFAVTTVLMMRGQWPLLSAIVFIFTLLTTLQVGYLVGVMLSSAWQRIASRRHASQISAGRR